MHVHSRAASMYAAFEVVAPSPALAAAAAAHGDTPIAVTVWTTTPWTMPANLAVAVNEKLQYCLVRHGGRLLVAAAELVPALSAKLAPEGPPLEVRAGV
jgi:isoleucyl-tRNA synthetase